MIKSDGMPERSEVLTMTKECYIMSFEEAIEAADRFLRDGYDIEIRRIGNNAALVFALRKKKIKRSDQSDRN